ncbi:DUF1512 domain-containing protein [Candidatus Bathyarchaeota archaeon]|nr:DUF1512 domain-containing protein [Candidatus Bathyarchaeota archaeon]
MMLQQPQEPWTIIFNLIFYVFLFISIFYGQKIQYWQYSKKVESSLVKIKEKRQETKDRVKTKIIELRKRIEDHKPPAERDGSKAKLSAKELDTFLDEFMQFFMIQPESMDPAGIVGKLDQLIDVRENRWDDTVQELVPGIDETWASNLENLIEAALAVDSVYRIVRHFYVQGKKTKSLIFVMQIAMQIKIIEQMVDAYAKASKAFYHGQPIGDALGPQVAATLVRDLVAGGVEPEDICKETILQEVKYNGRTLHVIRAKGPGGTVGKPGQAIKLQVEKLGGKVNRIIMIDAAMKLEGEASGSIVEGVGAAIGGIGVEKFKIEDSSTTASIPIDAIICKQNLVDAITTMRKSISNSVKKIVERIKIAIDKRTKEGDVIILAGIGNTIGIGI